ncbi:rod shape-determining protein [Actinobacteria bacterium YIM 96077]|uniref:Cell shape-determining protein MreB n=1 Tax=Phytoactinopolyspora halophila TaxID=1981511 RepID=A0A329QZ37_9ACTN|nr:rod shape-determining protein [Phytoactinopolyspora halophila]AYY15482.1 rod shape-determining protein [Actinobacteria bacterium YIM 96077]RAW17660.1 rod shape-determining protein [Phytoactinopolyspora halophila]
MGGFGVDLGTANTVVVQPKRGIVFDEPSVMLARADEPTVPILVGEDARQLIGRTPVGFQTVRPLQDGVIVDLESARSFIVAILRKARQHVWSGLRRRAVIGVPTGATTLECRALLEAGHEAGLRKVALLPEPVAGALGSGIDPLEPRAHLVVDVGGGTAEITGFCYGGILASRTCRVAGDELTRTLSQYLRSEHQLVVGDLTAENLKVAMDALADPPLIVEGRDGATGRARLVTLENDEVKEALRTTVDEIVQTLTSCLEDLPAQAVGDIMSHGVLAIGGGALMSGFTQLLEEHFGFPVKLADRPLTCVAEGASVAMMHPEVLAAYGG